MQCSTRLRSRHLERNEAARDAVPVTDVALACGFVELPDLKSVFDDVRSCFQSIGLLHRGLQAAGGCPELRVVQDGLCGVAQSRHIQLSS